MLAGQRVLITAGPTFEAIDPVRGITNLSSGKMGFAIARVAREAGADVTLVAGPVHLPTPRGVRRVDVKSAQNMLQAVEEQAQGATVFVATAAVADWRVAAQSAEKIKKDGSGQPPRCIFVENPDILARVAQSPQAQSGELYCVGFGRRKPRPAGACHRQACSQGRAAASGQHWSGHVWAGRQCPAVGGCAGAQRVAACFKRALAQQLVGEIARRLQR